MNEGYFEINWITELVRNQEPGRADLIQQLEKCPIRRWIRQPYVRLISSKGMKQSDAKLAIAENVVLDHETEGAIVLDILNDGRIMGVEFLSQIPR